MMMSANVGIFQFFPTFAIVFYHSDGRKKT